MEESSAHPPDVGSNDVDAKYTAPPPDVGGNDVDVKYSAPPSAFTSFDALKGRIREHYEVCSDYYYSLWQAT
jgi:hypothetical protein